MIQELFGGGASLVGGGGGGGERKVSFTGILEGSSSPFTTNTTTTGATTIAPADQENLRCPRCDSSNTKFCYYNNYNLTQPRHFCKTCRRYWTKGGALRNVPIGGGCRKNKGTSPSVTAAVGKAKTATAEFGKSNLGFDLEPASNNQLLWASPQTSHLMALLRATQNQNTTPNPNPSSNCGGTAPTTTIKEERSAMIGSYNMASESALGTTSSALNARPIGVDLLSQIPVGLCNSFWRNNQYQSQQHSFLMGDQQQQQQQGQNTGIQELFQRLRSSGNYYSDHSPTSHFTNNMVSPPTSTPSSMMEPSPITAAEVGYWNNPAFSWANLPATNGAFP